MREKDGRKIRGDEVLPLLEELGERLAKRGLTAEAYVGGGAAISLRYGTRESTDDVDARMKNEAAILEEAAIIRERDGLQSDWVNSKFKGFIPTEREDDEATEMQLGGLKVRVASPEFLLAMKINAQRAKDFDDMLVLIRDLKIISAHEIARLATDLYGNETVPEVQYDDCYFYARRMLMEVRKLDPAWPADPDEPEKPTPAKQPMAAQPRDHIGRFAEKHNSPPEVSL